MLGKLAGAVLALFFAGAAGTGTAQAFAVYGAIAEKYNALGGPGGVLGQPLSDEADAPYGGRFNNFQGGAIYWHPSIGAFAVWGAIFQKWNELGRVEYGYPITDESGTPDGRGRYNHFRRVDKGWEASIYWTPQTGAHAVYGAIRDKWASMGWERSHLGYPTSDEYQDGGYRRSDFEGGYIRWSPNGGAEVMNYGAAVSKPGGFGDITIRGIEVAVKGRVIAGDSNFLSEPAICGFWAQNVGRLDGVMKDLVRGTVNPRMGRFSIRSDAQMVLARACSAKAAVLAACGADKVVVQVALPRNLFKFHVTTPSVLGSWADPEFSVDWDMEGRIDIALPRTAGQPMGVSAMSFRVSNVKLDSQNASGDLAKALAKVYGFFTGNDILAQAQQDRAFSFPGVMQRVADFNPALRQIPAGYHIDSCINGRVLQLNATDVVDSGPMPIVK